MRVIALMLFALLLSPSPAWVQTRKPASLTELVSYMGADREQMLYAGAKAEGKLMWYTSLAGVQGAHRSIRGEIRRGPSRRLPRRRLGVVCQDNRRVQSRAQPRGRDRNHRGKSHVHARFSAAPAL